MSRSLRVYKTKVKKLARLKRITAKSYAAIGFVKVNVLLQTPKICSCHMCGNARKHYRRRTLKEERDLVDYKEQLKSLSLIPSYR